MKHQLDAAKERISEVKDGLEEIPRVATLRIGKEKLRNKEDAVKKLHMQVIPVL